MLFSWQQLNLPSVTTPKMVPPLVCRLFKPEDQAGLVSVFERAWSKQGELTLAYILQPVFIILVGVVARVVKEGLELDKLDDKSAPISSAVSTGAWISGQAIKKLASLKLDLCVLPCILLSHRPCSSAGRATGGCKS